MAHAMRAVVHECGYIPPSPPPCAFARGGRRRLRVPPSRRRRADGCRSGSTGGVRGAVVVARAHGRRCGLVGRRPRPPPPTDGLLRRWIGGGAETPRPFDFIVDGQLVRGTLEKLILDKQLSAVRPPAETPVTPQTSQSNVGCSGCGSLPLSACTRTMRGEVRLAHGSCQTRPIGPEPWN